MLSVTLSYEQWCEIESYQRRKRVITDRFLGPRIRRDASTSPSQMGAVLSLAGVEGGAQKVDAHRKCRKGATVTDLERITERRNRIAREGDRVGFSRATIDVKSVRAELAILRGVAEAIDSILPRE